jgi:hypothetical protein
MRITESQLRRIIREEAQRLNEGKSKDVAESILDEIGMKGARDLHDAFRAGTPAAMESLEELIDDHSDGEMDASSPKVQEKVIGHLGKMVGIR